MASRDETPGGILPSTSKAVVVDVTIGSSQQVAQAPQQTGVAGGAYGVPTARILGFALLLAAAISLAVGLGVGLGLKTTTSSSSSSSAAAAPPSTTGVAFRVSLSVVLDGPLPLFTDANLTAALPGIEADAALALNVSATDVQTRSVLQVQQNGTALYSWQSPAADFASGRRRLLASGVAGGAVPVQQTTFRFSVKVPSGSNLASLEAEAAAGGVPLLGVASSAVIFTNPTPLPAPTSSATPTGSPAATTLASHIATPSVSRTTAASVSRTRSTSASRTPSKSASITPTPPPPLSAPMAVAVEASTGDLVVANVGDGSVKKIPGGGGAVVTLGSGFSATFWVAVANGTGHVYVSDTLRSVIQKFEGGTPGTPVTIASIPAPGRIAVAPNGDVYVGDFANNTIYVIPGGLPGSPVAVATINQPSRIAVDTNGDLYAASLLDYSISKISGGTGSPQVIKSLLGPIADLAVAPGGDIYVAYGDPQLFVVPGGTGTRALVSSDFIVVSGVAVAQNGDVFVADTGGSFDLGGIWKVPGGTGTPAKLQFP